MNQPPLFPEFLGDPKPVERAEKPVEPAPAVIQSEWIEHAISALRNIKEYKAIIGRLHIFLAHLTPNDTIWSPLGQLKTQYDTIESKLTLAKITQRAADKEYDTWDGRGGMMPEHVRLGIQTANSIVNELMEERDMIANNIITLLKQHFDTQK